MSSRSVNLRIIAPAGTGPGLRPSAVAMRVRRLSFRDLGAEADTVKGLFGRGGDGKSKFGSGYVEWLELPNVL